MSYVNFDALLGCTYCANSDTAVFHSPDGTSQTIKLSDIKWASDSNTMPYNKKNSFYDDKTLDYILKDIIKEKAKEAEKALKKEVEEGKREEINRFSKKIRNVYFNEPYTIIVWKDGSKSIVKCQEGDEYDKEKGFALALLKHIFGDTNYFNTIFKDWIKEEEE